MKHKGKCFKNMALLVLFIVCFLYGCMAGGNSGVSGVGVIGSKGHYSVRRIQAQLEELDSESQSLRSPA